MRNWLLAGFTFGYFFDPIRGWSGTLKGSRVALVIVASSTLVWLTQTGFQPDWPTIVGGPAITLIFYTFIGLWVFNRMALEMGGQSLQALSRQGGFGRVLKVISPFTASLALTMFNALSGGLSSAASEVQKGIVAQPCSGPPTTLASIDNVQPKHVRTAWTLWSTSVLHARVVPARPQSYSVVEGFGENGTAF